MATVAAFPQCCAVDVLQNISVDRDPKAVLESLCSYKMRHSYDHNVNRYEGPFVYTGNMMVVFTGVVDRVARDHASGRKDDYGTTFAQFIKKLRLGTIVETTAFKGKSGNTLKVWCWKVNKTGLERWWNTEKGFIPPAPKRAIKRKKVEDGPTS